MYQVKGDLVVPLDDDRCEDNPKNLLFFTLEDYQEYQRKCEEVKKEK